ncbi:MAG: DNA repair protein RecO [Candidatus Marinimicrobia bacterium]|nr:DNA repair protein RecO [Candidatus Neomarinimicrobiota bacterium]
MPILKSEGVVLRRIKYSETSLIVTFYTKDQGKISLIAKGARNPKSKFVGALEPATYASIVYYHKDSRDLQLLSEIEILQSNSSIIENLRKSAVAMAILNLVDSTLTEVEPNEDVYGLLVNTLSALNSEKQDVALLWYFEIQLLKMIGFEIDVHNPEGVKTQSRLKGEALRIFEELETAKLPDIGVGGFTRGAFRKINRFFSEYFKYHVEGMKRAKALSFVENLI